MGINLSRLRLSLVVGVSCVVGAGTAVAGAIGFVGLVVPHILRPFVGGRPSRLLWASALGGAALVLAAVSMLGFVCLTLGVGGYNAAIAKVLFVDVVGIVFVLAAALLKFRAV